MSTIKGMDKAQKRFRDMAKRYPQINKQAMHDATIKIEGKAISNVTGGNPLFVSDGHLRAAIHSVVKQSGSITVGTVGIPPHVSYGRVHELGEPAVIYPKKGKYLRFTVGRGMSSGARRKKGNWVTVTSVRVKKRPWLYPAKKASMPFIRKRFARITQDLLKAAR